MLDKALIAPALTWVGQPYSDCYKLVQRAFRLANIELPDDQEAAQSLFVRVWLNEGLGVSFVPQAFDVLRIANRYVDGQPFVNHVGIGIGIGRDFLHSMEDIGTTICDLGRHPWRHRVRSIERYRG